jgi:hypothetical protein
LSEGLGLAGLDYDIFCKRFEAFTVFLHDRYGDMASLADLDISNGSGLACVRSAGNQTEITIVQFFDHRCPYEI